MLTISNTALETARNVNGSFVVSIINSPTCCSGGARKSFGVDLCENFTDRNNSYIVFQYEGVNVYISKILKLKDKVEIYQKIKLPFIGPIFGSKGIYL